MTCSEVRQHILRLISRGGIAPGGRLPTFRVLARDCGTSVPTVQRAVAMLVSEGVLVSRIGSGTYVLERGSRPAGKLLGVLFPSGGNMFRNFCSEAEDAIREVFLAADCVPVVVYPRRALRGRERKEEELKLIRQMLRQGIAGLIVNSGSGLRLEPELRSSGIPVVYFNNPGTDRGGFDFVTSDNYQIGRLAADRLIGAGKTPCAIVADSVTTDAVADRITGFRDRLREAGVPEPEVIDSDRLPVPFPLETAERFAGVHGIFGTNDSDAMNSLDLCRRAGLRVPGDIGVIGVDDNEICEHVTPRLDSIRQHAAAMGRKAAELLLDRVRNGAGIDFVTVRFCGELVERESVVPGSGAGREKGATNPD